MSPYTIIYVFIAYRIGGFLLSWWIKRGSAKWELRMKTFAANHHEKVIVGDPSKQLLFVVVPSSGAGKAMDIYDKCVEELQKRNFYIEVYVTKSSDDIRTLLERRHDDGKDISKYYGIIMLSGDSSIAELMQRPLAQGKDKWMYPPILHLPGGSTNLLTKEFHHGKSYLEILRKFSVDKVRHACVIKLLNVKSSSDSASYATHIAFHGLGTYMITETEKHRHGLYAVFGKLAIPFIVLKVIFSPPNKNESPYFSLTIASTKNFMGGEDSGFGIDLFDNNLVMIHLKQFKGPLHYIKQCMIGMLSGDMAKQYFESKLPDDVEIRIASQFTFEDHDLHFTLDGTTAISGKGSHIAVESLREGMPYFVL